MSQSQEVIEVLKSVSKDFDSLEGYRKNGYRGFSVSSRSEKYTSISSEDIEVIRVFLKAINKEHDTDPHEYPYLELGWVLSSVITSCMSCSQPFGWSRWKHHCRACGFVVCSECLKEARIQELDLLDLEKHKESVCTKHNEVLISISEGVAMQEAMYHMYRNQASCDGIVIVDTVDTIHTREQIDTRGAADQKEVEESEADEKEETIGLGTAQLYTSIYDEIELLHNKVGDIFEASRRAADILQYLGALSEELEQGRSEDLKVEALLPSLPSLPPSISYTL